MLAPCGRLNLYWGIFHHVHAFLIVFIFWCMLDVWQNVQVTFFGCIGLKWVPLLEFIFFELVSHALDGFNSFCASMPCLAHTVHTLGVSSPPPPMHHVLHTYASAHTQHQHTHALLLIHALCLCFMINSLAWCLSLFTLFLSKLCSIFRLFLFVFWTHLNLIKFCVLSCVHTWFFSICISLHRWLLLSMQLKENLVLYPIQNTQWKRQTWIYFIHDW